jgi:hypothetical protein
VSGVLGHICNPSTREAETGRCELEASLGYIVAILYLSQKTNKTKDICKTKTRTNKRKQESMSQVIVG